MSLWMVLVCSLPCLVPLRFCPVRTKSVAALLVLLLPLPRVSVTNCTTRSVYSQWSHLTGVVQLGSSRTATRNVAAVLSSKRKAESGKRIDMTSTRDTKLFDTCDPWQGDKDTFEDVFVEDFTTGTRQVPRRLRYATSCYASVCAAGPHTAAVDTPPSRR